MGNGTAGNTSGSLTLGSLTQRAPFANTVIVEDFTFCNNLTVTGAQIAQCDTNWEVSPTAGGGTTGLFAAQAATFANPGQLRLTTPATSGQGITLYKSAAGTGGTGSLGNLFANAGWDSNFIVQSGVGVTAICIRLGFCIAGATNGDAPTDWFGMEFDTANTGNTDTKFTWVTSTASTPTYSTVNAKVADTSFHRFRFRSLVAGTVLMSVDGGTETSVTPNNAGVGIFLQVIPRGAVAQRLVVDYVSYVAATGRT
jgi:hypothetical protein